MKYLKSNFFLAGVMAVGFLLVGVVTLRDYGISWDEPAHFIRGQAYVDFFLTGDENYKSLASREVVSCYEVPSASAGFYFEEDSGHPPLNGIMAAFFNRFFYQTLGVLGDIESYHLFNLLVSTFLVFVVVAFAGEAYGTWVGVVSGWALMTYPLFFAESHFNIKDPAETAFFAACIWAVWKAFQGYSWKWLLTASIFFGVGLSIKFNILFLPLVILPWFLLRFGREFLTGAGSWLSRIPGKFVVMAILSPLVVGGIFFGSWPYLWRDALSHTRNIVEYYQDIGTGGRGQLGYLLPGGFNTFASVWVMITTPPWVLILGLVGVILAVVRFGEKEKTAWLWLLWFLVPILRVSWPNSSIYGGVRQIMEFVPALALLCGLGAEGLFNLVQGSRFKVQNLRVYFCILFFAFSIYPIVKWHPNENVYFNGFIGGLKGARERNIPYWGNSFGNAYYQATEWLNEKAEPGSKLALIQGTAVNIPRVYLGENVAYSNSYWSGVDRKGEYLLELTHQGNEIAYPYAWYYANTVLEPVYEVEADGVAIAKVWKNDKENSKPEYKEERWVSTRVKVKGDTVTFELERAVSLVRMRLDFGEDSKCGTVAGGVVQISVDGEDWQTEEEKISDWQVSGYRSLEGGLVRYAFYGRKARYVRVVAENEESCLFEGLRSNFWEFGG